MKYALFIASAASICSVAAAQPFSIEFDTGVAEWRTVLDGVMGGRSSGRITQPEAGILRFSGELSLENNGGFSQMQATVPEAAFKNTIGIEARVRGDGRTYQFNVRSSDVRVRASSFQTRFDTVAGEWVTLRLPFDGFRLYSFGRLVSDAPELSPARVQSVGVTLSDKNPGAFQLDIDFIRAISPTGEAAMAGSNLGGIDRVTDADPSAARTLPTEGSKAAAMRVSGLVELAIERGVPLFNDGKPEACAAIYEVTISAIIDLAADAVGNDAVERLRLTLAEGQAEKDASRRAWIFRRAMDRVYQDAIQQNPR